MTALPRTTRPVSVVDPDGPASSIRIVPELRAVHIERHPAMTPAENLYFATKYDLANTPLPPSVTRVTAFTALRRLVESDLQTLELPEPLWMRFLPTWLALALAWKASGIVRRRPRRIVTYAMELTPFATLLAGPRRPPRAVVNAAGWMIGALIRFFVDRICFASPAAADLYLRLPFVERIEHRTALELPAARPAAVGPAPQRVAFVGLLARRNGIDVLMHAWERVESCAPSARLTIIGDGPEGPAVRAWADARPASRAALGHLQRRDVLAQLQRTSVLAAPSVPEGRWREQIGLPVKEALAAGATVVTTRQTGLADWLAEHGHPVVEVDGDLPTRLADALLGALTNPIDRRSVLEALPTTDRRLASDHWLHGCSQSDEPADDSLAAEEHP